MAEWSKAHDWKSCVRPKRTEGSNPSLSAIKTKKTLLVSVFFVLNLVEELDLNPRKEGSAPERKAGGRTPVSNSS